jgi:hypothetical protein
MAPPSLSPLRIESSKDFKLEDCISRAECSIPDPHMDVSDLSDLEHADEEEDQVGYTRLRSTSE